MQKKIAKTKYYAILIRAKQFKNNLDMDRYSSGLRGMLGKLVGR